MAQVTPSIDFPVRTAPLDGSEWLIKQNAAEDSTPSPKEEMVPTGLILDYVLTNLPDGLVQVSGGTVSGTDLLLHRTNNVDIVIDASEWFDIISGVTIGSSTVQYKGRGISAELNAGEITITVATGGRLSALSMFIDNADMDFTDGSFITNDGILITIDNSANSAFTLYKTPRVWKKAFSGTVSDSNPGQAQNPLDTNEVVYSITGGIFTFGYDDAKANYPNGMILGL